MATLFPEFEPGNGAGNLHRKETAVFGREGEEDAVKETSNE
jgi:hypothetical protein